MEHSAKDFPSIENSLAREHCFLQMSRNVKYLERFEYVCRVCDKKGTVLDVLLNPEVLLIRGFCPACNKRGTYKVVDIEALRHEHDAIAAEESAGKCKTTSAAKAKKKAEVTWKWELMDGKEKPNS